MFFLERGWILCSVAQTRCGCDIQIRTVCQHTECLVCWMSFVCEQENVSVQSQLFICFLLSFFVLLYTTFFISRTVFENVHSMFSSQVEHTNNIYWRDQKSPTNIYFYFLSWRKQYFETVIFSSLNTKYCTQLSPFTSQTFFLSAHWNMRRANTKNVCLRLRWAVDSQIFVRAFSQKCNNHKCWLDKNAARKQSERYFDACGERSARTWKNHIYVEQQKFHLGIKVHHYVVVCGVCQLWFMGEIVAGTSTESV